MSNRDLFAESDAHKRAIEQILARLNNMSDSNGNIRMTGGGGSTVGVLTTHTHAGTGQGGSTLQPVAVKLVAATELTLDTDGAITVTQSHHTIDTFEDAASDSVVTIAGLVANTLYLFRPAHTDRTIIFDHAADNVFCVGGADITCDDIEDWVWGFSPDGVSIYVK